MPFAPHQCWTISSPVSPQIYLVRSSLYASILDECAIERTLPEDELVRAGHYQDILARERYLCGRIVLRRLLAGVLQQMPKDIVLVRSARGKPALATGGVPPVEFSLSHCSDGLAVALSPDTVGVDIEAVDVRNWQRVAARYFSSREQAWLHAAGDPASAFRALWTAKESLVKLVDGSLPRILRIDCLPAMDKADTASCVLAHGQYAHVTTYAQACGTCLSLARYQADADRVPPGATLLFSLHGNEWNPLNLTPLSQTSLQVPPSKLDYKHLPQLDDSQ